MSNIKALASIHYEYSYQIYEDIIKHWSKKDSLNPDAQKTVERFSKLVSMDMYLNRSSRNNQFFVTNDEIEAYADTAIIPLNSNILRNKSFFNRYRNQFFFGHKSILEYFLALSLVENIQYTSNFDFRGMSDTVKFYFEMIWNQETSKILTNMSGLFRKKGQIEDQNLAKIFNLNIEGLLQINRLLISENNLSEISSLRCFLQLEFLDLSNNNITSIASLSVLKNLKTLYLNNNNIRNLESLHQLSQLSILNLSGNRLVNDNEKEKLKQHLPGCSVTF